MNTPAKTVLLLGATGTIGRATAKALQAAGHIVIAPVRAGSDHDALPGSVPSDLTEAALTDLISNHKCTSVISCLASRSGVPADARAIDRDLNRTALQAAVNAGATQFILLSAICVQKPKLAFQRAKLEFEANLKAAPLDWSIVRPTAYFKSLSGQVDRLRAGKPFLLFGDGHLTACKPISDADLGRYLTLCLTDADKQNRILPIGGPGPAISPRAQGEMLFNALNLPARYKQVPVAMMSTIIAVLSALGTVIPRLRDKAELARIGRYYATESMLVWDELSEAYDPDATPEFGTGTLAEHYAQLARGEVKDDRGAHKVF